MEKLSIEQLSERAHNKAFSKMIYIEKDIQRLQQEIRDGGNGSVPIDLLKTSLEATQRDLQVWSYIAKLIETDDFREPIRKNIELLHGMMGLADPDHLDVDFEQVYKGNLPIG